MLKPILFSFLVLFAVGWVSAQPAKREFIHLSYDQAREKLSEGKFGELPKHIRELHVTGTIILLLKVDIEGNVESAQQIAGFTSYEYFREYFTSAVLYWRFEPFEVDGSPQPVNVLLSVPFLWGSIPIKNVESEEPN